MKWYLMTLATAFILLMTTAVVGDNHAKLATVLTLLGALPLLLLIALLYRVNNMEKKDREY